MRLIVTQCGTCQGESEVFQESGAGIHATANMGFVDCPDCDGTGEINMEYDDLLKSKDEEIRRLKNENLLLYGRLNNIIALAKEKFN